MLTVEDIAHRTGRSRRSAARDLATWSERGLRVQRVRLAGESRWRTVVDEADWQRWVSGTVEAA